MRGHVQIVAAITGLLLAAAGTQAQDKIGRGGSAPPPVDPPTATETETETDVPAATGDVLLSDSFTANWGTASDENSSIQYSNNALRFVVHTKNWFVWSTPDDQSYDDIHMEVTAFSSGVDPTTAFGLICNKQGTGADFYYLAVTPAGQYAIARSKQGESDVFLTNNGKWGTSESIARNAASYRVGADCGGGNLVLYVDGVEIARASDEVYGAGGVAVMVWSGEEATNTEVSFDDFLMTRLE